jgi:hypothetical protein
MRSVLTAAALLMASANPPAAEAQQERRYDARYGTPVDVTLNDLTMGVVSYNGGAVRTTGNLDISPVGDGSSAPVYRLREAGAWVFIVPMWQRDGRLDTDLLRFLGRQVTVTGLFQERGASMMTPTTATSPAEGTIRFWKIEGPTEKRTKDRFPAAERLTLQELVEGPGPEQAGIVRVVGQFRGRNLYGDLPIDSQRKAGDWVIKSADCAAWVTGRKPKGDGFDLEVLSKSDTNKWLEVVGRVTSRNGVVYIDALQVTLTSEPPPEAQAERPH